MWFRATLAMEESRISMKVARVTVRAMIHGLKRGFQVEIACCSASVMESCSALAESNSSSLDSDAQGCARRRWGWQALEIRYRLGLPSGEAAAFTSGTTDMPGRNRPSELKSGLSLLSKSMRTGMR